MQKYCQSQKIEGIHNYFIKSVVSFCFTFMQKGEVLLDDREQGDDWWLEVLIAEDIPVLGHVS